MSDTARGVVVHITSGNEGDWRQALRNLSNLYDDESVAIPPARMTVVVNGGAVRFLRAESPESDQLARIASSGVRISACASSLDRLGYDPDSLAEGVDTVASGVAEAVRLQTRNNGYLKLP